MTLGRIRGFGPTALAFFLLGALTLSTNAGPIGADQPWPTPPPGPRPQVPRVIAESEIKRVEVPRVPGASAAVVLPLSMPLPRFPRVPNFSFDWPGGVRLIADAGSLSTTVQLVYTPVAVDAAPQPPARQQLRLAFNLRAFDPQAKETTLNLLRPWVLEIPARGLIRELEDPARLLVLRHDAKKGWVPLITTYHRTRGILQVRILDDGLFAVVMEPNVVAG